MLVYVTMDDVSLPILSSPTPYHVPVPIE